MDETGHPLMPKAGMAQHEVATEADAVSQQAPSPYPGVREKFDRICERLQLDAADRSQLGEMKAASQLGWTIYGQYRSKDDVIAFPAGSEPDDYLITHEIIHAICWKKLKYAGSHGLPYIVLHDLVVTYFFENNPELGNGAVVDGQWSSLGSKKARDAMKEKARNMVLAIRMEIDSEDAPGACSMLSMAEKVGKHTEGRYRGDLFKNPRALFHWFDRVWSQKQAAYPLVRRVLWCTSITCLLAGLACFAFIGKIYGDQVPVFLKALTWGLFGAAVASFVVSRIFAYLAKKIWGYDLDAM